MKTITIKQPWASLIAHGIKDIENRTWNTKFRGRVLIHASLSKSEQYWMDKPIIKNYWEELGSYAGIPQNEMREAMRKTCPQILGAIIGSVEIVDCVINHPSIWAEKCDPIYKYGTNKIVEAKYNWILANPILFPEPIPAKGRLSLWDYPNILAELEEKDGELFCHCQLPVEEENQVMSLAGEYSCNYCGGKWYK